QLPFRTYFPRHTRYFRGETAQLVHHRIDRILELQNLTLHVHRDLTAQVTVGHRRGHLGDVAHLRGQVTRHLIHGIGEVLPGSAYPRYVGLATQLTFRSHITGHTRYFGTKRVQLVHHRIDRILQLQDLSFYVHRDLATKVTLRHRGGHLGDVPHLRRKVTRHHVHRVRSVVRGARYTFYRGLATQLTFRTHLTRHTRHLEGEGVQLVHHRIDRILQLEDLSFYIHRDLPA